MTAEVLPMIRPDADAMREQLDHLFGGFLDGCHEGKIELAWTNSTPDESGKYKLVHAEMFGTDQMEELIAKACAVNVNAKCNVYIGAALRDPNIAPVGRSKDADFYAATAVWLDLDDADANKSAPHHFAGAKPTMVVRTGAIPHKRHQLWWRLSEPITDASRISALVKGLAVRFSGDGSVANPGRVMRLAGSIAWDQKPGRVPETTGIIPLKEPGPTTYLPDHLEIVYPPLFDLDTARGLKERNERGPDNGIVRAKNGLGLETGPVTDGREKYMRDLICARLIEYVGRFGAAPSAEELFDEAWPIYEQTADLSRAGRGKHEFMDKCRYTVGRFLRGEIPGVRTLEEAVRTYQQKKDARQSFVRHETIARDPAAVDKASGSTFELLDVRAIKAMPDPKWLVRGLVTDNGLGFIFGPPGCGKSFIAIGMALSIACGLDGWWGRKIERRGPVAYVSSEGQSDLKFRIRAWEQESGISADDAPFYLIRQSVNFMAPADVQTLLRTLATLPEPPAMVFVDTVSRVLPGADENLQKDMTLFIAACDAVREHFGSTVVGVHHTSRNGNLRGSTVFDGAGDFLAQIEREEGAKIGTLKAKKIKAAEDGWEQAFTLESVPIAGSITPTTSLFAKPCVAPVAVEKPTPGHWPDAATCKLILAFVATRSRSQKPLSSAVQTRSLGRYFPDVIASEFGVKPGVAKEIMVAWLASGLMDQAEIDKKKNLTGLVVTDHIGA